MGGRIRDKLCKWRLLWGRKGTSDISLGMVGRLCCTTGKEREVSGSSRIHIEKVKRGPTVKGGREKIVLTIEGSDTKLRIIGRFDLMVSQPFLYICVGQYTISMVEVTTQEYVDNISYITTFYWDDPYLFKYCPDQIFQRYIFNNEVSSVIKFCHSEACGDHFS